MILRVLFAAWVVGATLPSLHAASPSDTARWAEVAFGNRPVPEAPRLPSLTLRHQDYGLFQTNRSVIETPLKIGSRNFQRGLGTHANSEIAVNFPKGAATSFKAFVGVDNNDDTQGRLGSVEFAVEIGGTNVFRSRVLRGGEEPLAVAFDIPPAASEIILKTGTSPDGPAHDHADWADAQLVINDGSILWLDTLANQSGDFWPLPKPPFSFVYNGQSSPQLLDAWPAKVETRNGEDRTQYSIQWTDPQSGLVARASAMAFKDFPAVEWVLRFENTGASDTPLLEKVQALDAVVNMAAGQNLVLDQINGDDCSERTFAPVERKCKAGDSLTLAPVGGRPSNGTFPFFNLDAGAGGFFVAIGWTGQWAASLNRDASSVRLQAGMELTRLRLQPGEAIRTPRILLLRWSGDRLDAHNQFRRLLLAHYLPKLQNESWPLAFSAQTFNRWAGGTRPQWATEAGQIAAAEVNRALGCDTLWFDAGWFEGNFPNGVGNWFPKPNQFPNGLKPVGEACEQRGLKFLVWYEPERVAPGTQLAREHPEFVLPAQKPPGAGGLFNLGEPQARRWLTDLLIREMTDNRKYWTGDFIPLTPWTMAADGLMAWQLHRPDLNEGAVLAFRHKESPYAALQAALHGLSPAQSYRVTFIDEDHRATVRTMTGAELAAVELRLPARHTSLLVRYAPEK